MPTEFLLRSRDRKQTDSTQSPQRLTLTWDRAPPDGRYKVEWITFANNVFNVSYYNTIYFTENGTDKTATIASGHYTTSTIAAAIKTALDAASNSYQTFTVVLDPTTKKFTITGSVGAFALNFVRSAGAADRCAARLLGFREANYAAANPQISDYHINLSYPLSFVMNINGESEGFEITNSKASGTFVFPSRANYSELETYVPPNDNPIYFDTKCRKEWNISIMDTDRQLIDMSGSDWELKVRYVGPL